MAIIETAAAAAAPGWASVAGRVPAARLERLRERITLAARGRQAYGLRAPFTGELIAQVPLGTAEDVQEAVRRARQAQAGWAARSVRERTRPFLRFHDLVLERQDEVIDLIQLENGKARKFAFEEVADAALASRYYAHHGPGHLAPRRRRGALPLLTAAWEHHHPVGVVGFIAPWNYPLILSITDAVAALIAGNAVVVKPDQQSPFTALWAAALLDEAGLPADLLHIVTGRGRELGGPLLDEVDFVAFTGSTATGKTIARQAGERLIGCSLELGGKNPMIVLEDADLERAVDGAVRGCFANTGQMCIAIERLYVHASLHDRFLSRLAGAAAALPMRPGFEYGVEVGTLTSEDQLRKMRGHIEDALAKGARVVAGGRARPDLGPLFHEPTVLSGVTPQMDVFAEETFGPLVSVYRFEAEEEAVHRANATRYGLNASVWTRDTGRGLRVARRLQAGTVNVNEAYAATWASMDAPMGGFKESGLGRRHAAEGILKYTEPQTVAVQRLLPVVWPPGVSDSRFARFMSAALRLQRHLPGLR